MDIEHFMRRQRELQTKMKEANPTQGGDPLDMVEEELAHFLTWNVTALMAELAEMLNETGWKPWASSRHINGQEAIMEMVDAWHFFLNIMLAITAWDQSTIEEVASFFESYYIEKNDKNRQRQVDKYDGVSTKCKKCHRELSEVPELRDDLAHQQVCSQACLLEQGVR